jgi:single-strand DNA-binding protein
MINQATLVGHVGRDPEFNATRSGGRVGRFSLATSEQWKDKATGEKKERTEWHTVCVFSDGLVNVLERYVRKGSKLFVQGTIRTRKWQDQSGADRWSTEIHLSGFDAKIQLLDKAEGAGRPPMPEDDGRGGASTGGSGSTGGGGAARTGPMRDDLDDEIPF